MILLLGLWGCLTEPDCFDTTTNYVAMGFYDADDETINVLVDSIAVTGLQGYLIPEDSLNEFELPIDPSEIQSGITFYMGEEIHTLNLAYRIETQVISEDCGALAYIMDLKLTDSSFENITILNNRLATNAGINVKITLE